MPLARPMTMQRAMLAVAALPALLVAGGGCERPSSVALARCEGVVTLDGQPIPGWYVVFHPDADQATRGPASTGLTDAKGSFRMLATGRRDGAVVGQHRVFVVPPGADLPPGEVPPKTANVPARFQKPETSALVAKVEANRINRFTFELSSAKK